MTGSNGGYFPPRNVNQGEGSLDAQETLSIDAFFVEQTTLLVCQARKWSRPNKSFTTIKCQCFIPACVNLLVSKIN